MQYKTYEELDNTCAIGHSNFKPEILKRIKGWMERAYRVEKRINDGLIVCDKLGDPYTVIKDDFVNPDKIWIDYFVKD